MIHSITKYKSKNEISYNHSATYQAETEHPFYNAESHSMIEISLVISGSTTYFINGSQYHIGVGDLIVINAGEFHTSKTDHTEYYEHFNLHFSPNYIPKLKDIDASAPFSNANLYQHVIPREIVEKYNIERLLREISTVCDLSDEKYKELRIISIIQAIIAELNMINDTLLSDKHNFYTVPKISNELFQEAIQYINSQITENINVASVANALGVSESYLHRLFKNIMGVSVHNYIQNQKMQYALSLLRKGYSAKNVSEMLGYEYYATFFSHFQNVFKKPPTQLK